MVSTISQARARADSHMILSTTTEQNDEEVEGFTSTPESCLRVGSARKAAFESRESVTMVEHTLTQLPSGDRCRDERGIGSESPPQKHRAPTERGGLPSMAVIHQDCAPDPETEDDRSNMLRRIRPSFREKLPMFRTRPPMMSSTPRQHNLVRLSKEAASWKAKATGSVSQGVATRDRSSAACTKDVATRQRSLRLRKETASGNKAKATVSLSQDVAMRDRSSAGCPKGGAVRNERANYSASTPTPGVTAPSSLTDTAALAMATNERVEIESRIMNLVEDASLTKDLQCVWLGVESVDGIETPPTIRSMVSTSGRARLLFIRMKGANGQDGEGDPFSVSSSISRSKVHELLGGLLNVYRKCRLLGRLRGRLPEDEIPTHVAAACTT